MMFITNKQTKNLYNDIQKKCYGSMLFIISFLSFNYNIVEDLCNADT